MTRVNVWLDACNTSDSIRIHLITQKTATAQVSISLSPSSTTAARHFHISLSSSTSPFPSSVHGHRIPSVLLSRHFIPPQYPSVLLRRTLSFRKPIMDSGRIATAEQRIATDQWDIDAWQILLTEVEKSPFSDAKPIYERLVVHFPPIGKFWKSYAEHLIREDADKYDDIRTIYERAAKSAPTSVDLWLSYISFASSLALKVPGSKWESDAIAVYERAIAVAGLDLNAHPLWSHYIDFLKNHTTQSDSHRREALRRVYQRAVMIFHLAHLLYLCHVSLCTERASLHSRIIYPLDPFQINEKRTFPRKRMVAASLLFSPRILDENTCLAFVLVCRIVAYQCQSLGSVL